MTTGEREQRRAARGERRLSLAARRFSLSRQGRLRRIDRVGIVRAAPRANDRASWKPPEPTAAAGLASRRPRDEQVEAKRIWPDDEPLRQRDPTGASPSIITMRLGPAIDDGSGQAGGVCPPCPRAFDDPP
jgi:hypothetical protein